MEPKLTAVEFIQQVGEWSLANFGEEGQLSLYGILEELGEASHCILKHAQKIRGFKDDAFFQKELKDAFADCMVYLANFAAQKGAFFAFKHNNQKQKETKWSEMLIISQLLLGLSSLINFDESVANGSTLSETTVYSALCQRFTDLMEAWAATYDFNLEEITFETWRRVRNRNWKTDALVGGQQ